MHKDDNGRWIPNYVIKSPRECDSPLIKLENLENRILMVHKGKQELKRTNVFKYIEWGERKAYHKRPTCDSRVNWYDVGNQIPPPCLWFKAFNNRIVSPINISGFFVSDRFYPIYPTKKINPVILGALLNCTLQWLMVELSGRVNLGEGALDNMTYEAAAMDVIDPCKIDKKIADELANTIMELGKEPVESVYEELGFKSEDGKSKFEIKPARARLDKVVMGDLLGLTENEQFEVYEAVVDLVNTRLNRAQSVRKAGKTKEGVDINLLAENILSQLKDNEFITLVQKRCLSQKCFYRDLPPVKTNELSITNTLFGWRLKIGRADVDCSSEAHARYVKIFAEMGYEKVPIPQDDGYLSSIIDELEETFVATRSIIDDALSAVLQRKTREHVLHEVWSRVRELTGTTNAVKAHQSL